MVENAGQEITTITVHDLMASAFAAVLRGDLEERDRLVSIVRQCFPDGVESIPSDATIPLELLRPPEVKR
jgi:hypothetical protein